MEGGRKGGMRAKNVCMFILRLLSLSPSFPSFLPPSLPTSLPPSLPLSFPSSLPPSLSLFLSLSSFPSLSLLQALILSVITYALFEVSYKKWGTRKEDPAAVPNSARFLGYLGLQTLVWLWPFFIILHFSGVERFEWPPLG